MRCEHHALCAPLRLRMIDFLLDSGPRLPVERDDPGVWFLCAFVFYGPRKN